MTAPFADASVEVVANFDRFDDSFSRKLRQSVTTTAVASEKPLRGLTGNLGRAAGALAHLGLQFAKVIAKAIAAATAIGIVAGAIGVLTMQALALGGSLLPLGGLIVGLPAVIGGAVAAVAALKLAMQGLDDVVKALAAGDLDAFNKAMKGLSPNARLFATELRSLKPHFDSLRAGVQDKVFAGLSTTLRTLATNLFPTLRRGLGGLGAVLNTTVKQLAGFLSTRTARSDLAQVLESARLAAGNLGRAVAPLAKALLGVMVAAGPAIVRVTKAIGDAAGRFAVWVDAARDSGLLNRILADAMATARTFGGVLADVGGIIKSVFQAGAAGQAGNMLTTLKALTGQARAFLDSASGESTLAAVFTAIRETGTPVLALVGKIAGIVTGTLIPMMVELASKAGPGLGDLVDGLGKGLAALLPAAGPVGQALGDLGAALGPLLEIAAQGLAAALIPAANAIIRLLPLITPDLVKIGDAVQQAGFTALTTDLGLFTEALGFLADHIDSVRQVLPYLIGGFIAFKTAEAAGNVAALVSIPTRIAEIAVTRAHTKALRSQTTTMMEAVGAENLGIIARIRGRITEAASAVATGVRTAAIWLFLTAQRAATAIGVAFAAITSVQNIRDAASAVVLGVKTGALWLWTAAQSAASIAAGVWTAAQWALNIAMDANPIGLIVLGIVALVGVIVLAYKHSSTFRAILAATGEMFVTLWHWIVEGAQFIWKWIQIAFSFSPWGLFIRGIRLVIDHWGQIRAAIGRGAAAIGAFFADLGRRILALAAFFFFLPVRVAQALLEFRAAIVDRLGEAWDWAVNATRERITAVIGLVTGIRQKVLDALTRAKDWLLGAGKAVIDGMIQGLTDRFPLVKKAMDWLGEHLPAWVKKVLGIKSPSTVMYQIGVDTVDGYANGITSGEAKVKAAALRIKIAAAEAMAGPFLAHQPKDPFPYGKNAPPSLAHQPGDPFPYGRYLPPPKTQLQKDKELLAQLEKIAAGKGTPVKGLPDAGTGLGGTSGTGLTSKEDKRAKDRADALAARIAAAAEKHRVAMEDAGKFLGDGLLKGLTSTVPGIKAAADRMAGLLTKAIGRVAASPLVAALHADSLRLRALATERDSVAKQLTAAQKTLEGLVTDSARLRDQIAGKVRGSFDLVPSSGTRSVSSLLATMARAVKQSAGFARDVDRLAARGLAKPLLAQLAEAGPVAGAAMAARLAKASSGQLKALNAMSSRLEAAAVSTGNTVADAMYASGIHAAQGLVDGLKTKHKAIEDTMLAIATSIAAAIRKALGIKSPSQVMRGIGEQIGAGLALGILASVPPVKAAMDTLAGHVTIAPGPATGPGNGPRIPAQRTTAAAAAPAAPGAPAAARGPLVGTMNVNLPTGDPEAAAETVLNRLAAKVG